MSEEQKIEQAEQESDNEGVVKFKGKYIAAVGRRKTSVANIRLYKKGSGGIVVNGKKLSEYFSADKIAIVKHPLKLTGILKDIDLSINVKGGGSNGQAEAIRHGITRALILLDENYKSALKAVALMTRDARKKERKKPGLKKARRAPQWSKR
ncbi:MAG: 30S ribosomal protein S9 [Parcubacteria group bacterium ADurb.Bin316]|nr:MAG: 30S ribosomal protein S9 [Parcubacteria group bacterium ADurb.Bin316]HOZ55949.1 30S ribosomal protein S9 [bacterium]